MNNTILGMFLKHELRKSLNPDFNGLCRPYLHMSLTDEIADDLYDIIRGSLWNSLDDNLSYVIMTETENVLET